MQIKSSVRTGSARGARPVSDSSQDRSDEKQGPADHVLLSNNKRTAREWADWLKARSTLTSLVEPVGVSVGYAQHAGENLEILKEGASALFQGNFEELGSSVESLVHRGYHPDGVGGAIYESSMAIETVADASVGGLEVYAGIKEGDNFLVAMGAADLTEAVSKGSRLFDLDGLALGLAIAATVGKTALVGANMEKFSRTQKVKTFLDAGGSVASAAMKSGVMVPPALAVAAVAGLGQLAYMNVPAVRRRVDKVLDRMFGPETRPPSALKSLQ